MCCTLTRPVAQHLRHITLRGGWIPLAGCSKEPWAAQPGGKGRARDGRLSVIAWALCERTPRQSEPTTRAAGSGAEQRKGRAHRPAAGAAVRGLDHSAARGATPC